MDIITNLSLKPYNTFGIDIQAKHFVEAATNEEIKTFLSLPYHKTIPLLVIGGGSNILFTKDFEGTVLRVISKGIEKVKQEKNHIYIKACAGEVWDELVSYCVNNRYYGLENLSLIPGNVGTSPVQNIGAYGVELKSVFYELEAINIKSGEIITFTKQECKFGYRNSIFKRELKNQFIILSVIFRLNKFPVFTTQYGAIEEELKLLGIKELSIKSIRDAVCSIRRKKLPDHTVLGNAGSFFKNPVIPVTKYENLKILFPNIVAYKQEAGRVKIAAGWLIEQTGWKGKRFGDAGVHKDQALILVNYGNASGVEILNLANIIQASVNDKFGIKLEFEVNVL